MDEQKSKDQIFISIYDYYLYDSLKILSKLSLENQLLKCSGLKVAVFDYCGVISKHFSKFKECDVFAVTNPHESIFEYFDRYDVIFMATYEHQYVSSPKAFLHIICKYDEIKQIKAVEASKYDDSMIE